MWPFTNVCDQFKGRDNITVECLNKRDESGKRKCNIVEPIGICINDFNKLNKTLIKCGYEYDSSKISNTNVSGWYYSQTVFKKDK